MVKILRPTSDQEWKAALGKEARMPKIGERVIVEISGDPLGGTLMSGGVRLNPGTAMRVGGTIVQDLGDQWVVQLDVAFNGKNRMAVPKAALVA